MLNRFEISSLGLLPRSSLSPAGGSDISLERILALYFPGVQISLDTKSRLLHHHRDTSIQLRGSPPPREKRDADISPKGDALVIRSASAVLEVRGAQSKQPRRFEPQVVLDFFHYCLEVLNRLTKN